MAESYFGKCGMCIYCDLYNKNGSEFKCTEVSGNGFLPQKKLAIVSNPTAAVLQEISTMPVSIQRA